MTEKEGVVSQKAAQALAGLAAEAPASDSHPAQKEQEEATSAAAKVLADLKRQRQKAQPAAQTDEEDIPGFLRKEPSTVAVKPEAPPPSPISEQPPIEAPAEPITAESTPEQPPLERASPPPPPPAEEDVTSPEPEKPEWAEIIGDARTQLNTIKEKAAVQLEETKGKLEKITKPGKEKWILSSSKWTGTEKDRTWQETQSNQYRKSLRGQRTRAQNELIVASNGLLRLAQWEYYFSRPEVQSEIDEHREAITTLEKSIKGRKLAGVESAKLEKELEDHKEWLEKLKGNIPPEILGEKEEKIPGFYASTKAAQATTKVLYALETLAGLKPKEEAPAEKQPAIKETKVPAGKSPAEEAEAEKPDFFSTLAKHGKGEELTDEELLLLHESGIDIEDPKIKKRLNDLLTAQKEETPETPATKEVEKEVLEAEPVKSTEEELELVGPPAGEAEEAEPKITEAEDEKEPFETEAEPEVEGAEKELTEEARTEAETPTEEELEKEIRRRDKIWKALKKAAKNWWWSISPQGRNKIAWGIGVGVGLAESFLIVDYLPGIAWAKGLVNMAAINGVNLVLSKGYTRGINQLRDQAQKEEEKTKEQLEKQAKQLEEKYTKTGKYLRDFAAGVAAGSVAYGVGRIAFAAGEAAYQAYFRPPETFAVASSTPEVTVSTSTPTPGATSTPPVSPTPSPTATPVVSEMVSDAETLRQQAGTYTHKITEVGKKAQETITAPGIEISSPSQEFAQAATETLKTTPSPEVNLGSFFDQTVTIHDNFWSSVEVPPEVMPSGNWVNSLNGVQLEDVIRKMIIESARANGHELGIVREGQQIVLRQILTADQIEVITKAMQTGDVNTYWDKIRPLYLALLKK